MCVKSISNQQFIVNKYPLEIDLMLSSLTCNTFKIMKKNMFVRSSQITYNFTLKQKINAISIIGASGLLLIISLNYYMTDINGSQVREISEIKFPVLDKYGKIMILTGKVKTAFSTALTEEEESAVKQILEKSKRYSIDIKN